MELMLFRKFALFSAALMALCCTAPVRAQVSFYATITGEKTTGITCVDPSHVCASTDGAIRPYGSTFGAYYDFRNYGPVRFGIDLRGSVTNTNKPADYYQASTDQIRHYTALGGVRASLAKTVFHVRPYGQLDGGYARANANYQADKVVPSYYNTKFIPALDYRNYTQVEGVVGVDLPLTQLIDFRVIEFTGGAYFGANTNPTYSISTGLVFRFSRP